MIRPYFGADRNVLADERTPCRQISAESGVAAAGAASRHQIVAQSWSEMALPGASLVDYTPHSLVAS
jgi:hypothetical protein